jgi:FAD/FMN-containing dehydrogenase
VEVRAFAYVPGKYLEVTTFEVKPSDAITVQAVYEALAHRRAATRSYVLLDVPADRREASESAVAELCEVARAHGIGVVTAEDPANYETWEEREVAVRVEPDPEQLDAFIGRQLSDRARGEIGLALR